MTGKIIKDGGIKFLSETVNRIAHDDLMALDELLYTLPNREDIDPVILEIANSRSSRETRPTRTGGEFVIFYNPLLSPFIKGDFDW